MTLEQSAPMDNLQIISIAVPWDFQRGHGLFTKPPETIGIEQQIPSGLVWKTPALSL